MAESLLFRKGSLKGLEKATLIPGAVSFTTDEPAIYLDVQEGSDVVRKRVGDLIVKDTMSQLTAAAVGTWSTTALYYVIDGNALLKWNGSKWTQINSVSEIEANFNALDKIVNGYTDEDSGKEIPGLVERTTSLENKMDSVGESTDVYIPPVGETPAGGKDTLWGRLNAEIARSTTADTNLKDYIDTYMATADAMTYKGVVTAADDLPTAAEAAIEAGWTYKVGDNFAANDKIETDEAVILIGDLLIASRDLEKGTETIPNDFWHHISSGYEDIKDPVFVGSTVNPTSTQTAGAKVTLQSHAGHGCGDITIVGTTNSNVCVASAVDIDNEQTGSTNTVITLGLEWGTF